MKKHKPFYRGIIAGISFVAVVDLSLVHLALKAHRSFSHPSVDIVEPIIVIVALVIFLAVLRIEYKERN